MSAADVCIVGAGSSGVAAANALLERGVALDSRPSRGALARAQRMAETGT